MTTPPPASRVVRVFISSTFRDFGEERDLLVKRVFPELRRRARERFVEVIGVDLRWGITEEESQKGETLPICLREIERSRPYFIGLLGERYGWTPEAGQYPGELLERQPWLAEHAGGKSVTELEILHGVLNSPEMAGRAYFYFRDAAWSEGKGDGFRSEGEDERARLARLKERIRASPFPVAEYATPESLADRITEDLWRLIDAEYPESGVPDELERERRSHEAYAHERRRLYVGQEETVAALLARLEGASDEKGDEAAARTRTTLVTGESGTGKSALIANVLEKYRDAHPDHVVIEHYIGSTTDAADPAKLMQRIAGEIRKLTGSTREIESDPEKLEDQFAEWLAEASWWAGRRGVKVVIALDALDKLSGEERLRWLPRKTAPHLRIVLSSLACEARETLEKRGVETVEAKPFTNEVARAYLVETLARRGRSLPEREVERIVAHPRATLPIYLRTLVEELSVFGTHEGLPQRISECLAAEEPDDLFEVILARVEGDLGEENVRKPLEAIWASADGMSEDELIAFTGLSPLDLARLRLSLDDALYESGGLLRLAHAYMSKAVEDRYLPTEERKRALHKALGLWWETQEPSARMGRIVNRHFCWARAWDDLGRSLTEPRTGIVLLTAIPPAYLHWSWSRVAESRGASRVSEEVNARMQAVWSSWRTALDSQDSDLGVIQALIELLRISGCKGEFVRQVAVDGLALAQRRSGATPAARTVALFHGIIGDLEYADGSLDSAMQHYGDSLRAMGMIAQTDSNNRVLTQLATIKFKLGRTALDAGDSTTAERWLEESRKGVSEDLELARSDSGRVIRAINLERLGCLAEQCGDLDRANGLFRECLVLRRDLAERRGMPEDMRGLSTILSYCGHIALARGDSAAASGAFSEALSISAQLEADLETLESRRDLAVALLNAARVSDLPDESALVLDRFAAGVRLFRVLAMELGDLRSYRELAMSLDSLGRAFLMTGDQRSALESYREAVEWRRRVAAVTDSSDDLHELAGLLKRLAAVQGMHAEFADGLSTFEEALLIQRRLASHNVSDGNDATEMLLWSIERCRDYAFVSGSFRRAYELAIERWNLACEQLQGSASTSVNELLLSHALPVLRCELELSELALAQDSAQVSLEIVNSLASAFDDPSIDREEEQLDSTTLLRCADGLDLVAQLRGVQGDVTAERDARTRAAELRERAQALKAEEDARVNLADEESDKDNPRP